MVFVGTTGVYTNSKWNLRNLLCCFSSLSRDQVNLRSGDFFILFYFIFFGGEKKNSRLRPGLKTGVFGLKYGQDLENRVAHPHQEFPGVPPPPRPRCNAKNPLLAS